MDKSTALINAGKFARLVREYLSPEAIIMFGSYANGTPGKWSDIDIAVIFDGFQGKHLETSAYLWRLSYEIDGNIEPHLLDKADDPTGFVSDILRTGIEINA